MTKEKRDFKKRVQAVTYKALKATIKGFIFYGIYFVLSLFLAPISETVPGLQLAIEIFVMMYIFLAIIGELTSGTIFHHFINTAKALFVILYLILYLKNGIVSTTFQNVSLIVDLRLFLIVATLVSLLALAKSMLQAINFLNQKAENVHF